jgi:hypothetical protein
MKCFTKVVLVGAAIMLVGVVALTAAEGPNTARVRVTVSVSGENHQAPPELAPEDVLVYQDNQRRPVLDWKPVAGADMGRDFAILIDSSLGSAVSLQFPDLRKFIRSLPASAFIGIAYAENGSARFTQDFTAHKEKAAAALQITQGAIEAGASVFQSVSDLVKHWPDDGRARALLLVSNGVDFNRGVSESQPTLNPDLDEAIAEAQKGGVNTYTIYAGGAAPVTHTAFLLDNGQSSLQRLASETGGEAYFQGLETPVSFSPFLDQLREALTGQYLLTFQATLGTKPEYARLKVVTETRHVRITAPARVWIPRSSG